MDASAKGMQSEKGGVVGMLEEGIESDFARLEADTKGSEATCERCGGWEKKADCIKCTNCKWVAGPKYGWCVYKEDPSFMDASAKGMQSEKGGVVGMLEEGIDSDFARLEADTKGSEATCERCGGWEKKSDCIKCTNCKWVAGPKY